MLVRLRDSYVLASGEVTLTVHIGEGQKGFVEVQVDGVTIGRGPDIPKLSIGIGPALAGRRLRVTSTVADTSDKTNRTSVTYILKGGQQEQTYKSEQDVDAPGGTVDYDAIFRLL
jgi:hypothetical protein